MRNDSGSQRNDRVLGVGCWVLGVGGLGLKCHDIVYTEKMYDLSQL